MKKLWIVLILLGCAMAAGNKNYSIKDSGSDVVIQCAYGFEPIAHVNQPLHGAVVVMCVPVVPIGK